MQIVELYSDGSARRNPEGPGGYGTIVRVLNSFGNVCREEEFTEGFPSTTNNRMEMMGIIVGLESLSVPSNVTIVSDSKYVVDSMSKGWIYGWKKNGWKTSTGGDVKNKDLWLRLLDAKQYHKCEFIWVKGHNGHPENERCDQLATSSADKIPMKKGQDGKYHFEDGTQESQKSSIKLDEEIIDMLSNEGIDLSGDIKIKLKLIIKKYINQFYD